MDNQYELHNKSAFIPELQDCAKLLIAKLEDDSYQEASELICKMIEARDQHIFSAVGRLTRGLHNAIVNFNVDGDLESEPPTIEKSEINDATDRLNYVIDLTQKAADTTMDMVEESAPIAMNLGQEAASLRTEWSKLQRRELNKDEFLQLYNRMDDFLGQMTEGTSKLNENLQTIVLEQGFQDLTGQVLKRVIGLVKEVETELVNLVCMASQVEKITGIVRSGEEQPRGKPANNSAGEGPQIHAQQRDDVVKGQDEVDDLLSSLGF